MNSARFVIRPTDREQDWRVAQNCKAAIRAAIETLHPLHKAVEVRIGEAKNKRSLDQHACLHG